MIVTLWIALYAAVCVVVHQSQERGRERAPGEGHDTCFPCCGEEEGDEIEEEEQEGRQNQQEAGASTGALERMPDCFPDPGLTMLILGANVQGAHHQNHGHEGHHSHHGYDAHHSHHDGGYHHDAGDFGHHF